jgi:hypothetical protein
MKQKEVEISDILSCGYVVRKSWIIVSNVLTGATSVGVFGGGICGQPLRDHGADIAHLLVRVN